MDAAEAWLCPNCKAETFTPFCAQCGERPIKAQDLTFRGVAARLFHATTSVDGRWLRTAWKLLRHPGALTLAYMEGARKPHTPPFQLFLVANVFFFAIQSLTGINIFGSSLDSHLHQQDWSALAQTLLDRHLTSTHRSLEQYTPVFDRAAVLYAKSLVIVMVMPFALVLPLVFFGRHRPFMAHLVFSLHLHAFLMLLFCVAVLAAGIDVLAGGGGLKSPVVDNVLSVVNAAACAVYLYAAVGAAYGAAGWARVAKVAVLTTAVAAAVVGYRFVIFLLTLYVT